jgi:NADH dehydrogenase
MPEEPVELPSEDETIEQIEGDAEVSGALREAAATSTGAPRIVIVGGGFAGAYCARTLEKSLRPAEADVTIVNRSNYFVFTPLLVEAGTGALEPRHAVVPLRRYLRRTELLTADVNGIDVRRREVRLHYPDGSERLMPYDHLVIALGSVTRMPDVPGLREFGFGLKSLADAVALRDRTIGLLELASETDDVERRRAMLTFVIVGGNYTGVEVAGEFNEFLTEATRLYPNISQRDIRIVLVDHEPRILHTLDEELSQYASARLKRRGVELRLENTVTRIEKEAAELKVGGRVPAWTVIWAAGVAPNPLLSRLDVPRDKRGYLLCGPDLQMQGSESVWGIGDCAVNPDPAGNAYPPTAQHAIREGRQAAANIVHVLRHEPTQPLVYRSSGMMAPLGRHQAVARVLGWKFSGLPAWVLWRTVYLLKMPGFGRSLRVLMDWTLDWFFRRDYVQLGIHGTHHPGAVNPAEGESEGQPLAQQQIAAAGPLPTGETPRRSLRNRNLDEAPGILRES